MVKIISIDGVNYIKESDVKKVAETLDGMKYVMVRTQNAGVFAGYLKERNGEEITLKNARRMWYWSGACSLSQLAMEGTKKAGDCKFPCEVDTITLTQVIEIADCTEEARLSIKSVKEWRQD
jgi:hypothetical protein